MKSMPDITSNLTALPAGVAKIPYAIGGRLA